MKYVELHSASAFSFLEGSSRPEDLVSRAKELDLPAIALVDRDGEVLQVFDPQHHLLADSQVDHGAKEDLLANAQGLGEAGGLGADVAVDRSREDFVAVVKEVTGGRGADVVYDPVGGEAFRRSTKCIAFEGRILVVGFTSGDIPSAALNHALVKNYSILGLHWGLYQQRDPRAVRDCHAELTRLAAAGVIRPLISERLPLADVPDGLRRLADGATTGRIVFLP